MNQWEQPNPWMQTAQAAPPAQPRQPNQGEQTVQWGLTVPWGLSEEHLDRLGWKADRGMLEQLIYDEYLSAFGWRNLFPLLATGDNPDSIVDYRFQRPAAAAAGQATVIGAQPPLVTAEVSSDFIVRFDQRGDLGIARILVTQAPRELGLGAEFLIPYADKAENEVKNRGIATNVRFGNLYQLDASSRLVKQIKPKVPVEQPILDSIVQAIATAQGDGQFGPYFVVVGRTLYQQAYAPRGGAFDAPIYEIRPLLAENGFHVSNALPPDQGVLVSRGGASIFLACPRPAHLAWVDEQRDFVLRLLERSRLLVNDARAVVQLK